MKIETLTPQIAVLYLGQKCTIHLKHKVSTMPAGTEYVTEIEPATLYLLIHDSAIVTPHLRPLSSLTEAEAMQVYEMYFENPKPYHFKKTGKQWFKAAFFDNQMYPAFPAHIFTHLIRLGFDLFGLIDAGLAKEIINP